MRHMTHIAAHLPTLTMRFPYGDLRMGHRLCQNCDFTHIYILTVLYVYIA